MIKRLLEEFDKLEMESYRSVGFNYLLDEIEDLTNRNQHSEVLMRIAAYYDKPEYFAEFKKYKQLADNAGLTMEQCQERRTISHKMFDEIASQYGAGQINQIYDRI